VVRTGEGGGGWGESHREYHRAWWRAGGGVSFIFRIETDEIKVSYYFWHEGSKIKKPHAKEGFLIPTSLF
jgi:hypothetical protein